MQESTDGPSTYICVHSPAAALAVAFATCASAADQVEHVRTTTDVDAEALQLGNALAASGHHQEAVPHLQQALSIQRSRYGLFDLRQLDTLKTLAGSLTALNRVREAQDLMLYRVRAAEKTYGEGNPKVIPSLCDLGDWFSENLLSAEARLTFQMALNIVGASPALRDPIIVEPLRGMARTRMRAQSYPQAGDGRLVLAKRQEFNREGERRAQASSADRGDRSEPCDAGNPNRNADADGRLVSDQGVAARSTWYYQRAWQLIRTAPSLPDSVTNAFNVPLRVYYPTPPIVTHIPAVAPEDTRVPPRASGVHCHCRWIGSQRAHRGPRHERQYARDILDAVSESRFRPKFVDGQPVAASAITYREVFWTGKPRA